jgi:hypothetical protein
VEGGGCGKQSQQTGADPVYWFHRCDCSSIVACD